MANVEADAATMLLAVHVNLEDLRRRHTLGVERDIGLHPNDKIVPRPMPDRQPCVETRNLVLQMRTARIPGEYVCSNTVVLRLAGQSNP